jgi:glycerophosphoryl diester phosphodiesterase
MGGVAVAALRLASLSPTFMTPGLSGRLGAYGAAQIPIRRGPLPLVDRRIIETAHAVGLQVHVWTVDDEATMDRLLGLGVDGIMTDRPTALREVLVRRQSAP